LAEKEAAASEVLFSAAQVCGQLKRESANFLSVFNLSQSHFIVSSALYFSNLVAE